MPGQRDQHSGCVGAYLVEHDLFDFLLFSLPDNDAYSHRNGPHAQVASIAAADRQLERLVHAGGGLDALPRGARDDRAGRPLARARSSGASRLRARRVASWRRARGPASARAASRGAERSAVSARRAALGDDLRARRRSAATSCTARPRARRGGIPGVDLVMRRDGAARGGDRSASAASCASRPAATSSTCAARRWSVDGELAALGAHVEDGRLLTPDYPDALGARVVRADLPDRRRRAAARRARLRVRRLGRRRPRRRRQPRLAARAATRSARCCGAAPARSRRATRAAVDAAGRAADGDRALRLDGCRG